MNAATVTCVNCMTNCAACSSGTKCTSSNDGFYINDLNTDPSVISSCPVTCSKCSSSSVCTECITNFSITNNFCKYSLTCGDGTYLDETNEDTIVPTC